MLEVDGIAYDPRALDATERSFWGDLWRSGAPAVATERGIELGELGPVQATVVGALPEAPMLNLVLGATEPGAVADGHLARALAWAAARRVRCYVPVAAGLPESAAAEALLAERGCARGYGWMKFVRDVRPPQREAPPGVEVAELREGDGQLLGRIVAAGFGLPPWLARLFEGLPGRRGWRCYVARVDGEPVAAATMHLHAGIAECGAAATLVTARGRGCQSALLDRRIRDAAAAGCELLLVKTGERAEDRPSASYRNILRAGFREAYVRPNWVLAPPA
jgi:GNAT superfamily N-acetyltransferase